MAFLDDLELIRRSLGRSIVLPIPPACLALWEQAKAAEIAVGTLFILSRALTPGVCGGFDRETGDIWCHFNSRDENGARELLLCLLTLIACVKLHLPLPTTVEEDWEQTRSAHREAFTLARAWGRAELFTEEDLAQFLALDHYLYNCHVVAGELAGNLSPSITRNAYLALLDVQARYRWSDAQFEVALHGVREDDEMANAAVLDFDRCALRALWLSPNTHKRDRVFDPFGEYTLAQTPKAARVLRSALEQVAYHRAGNGTRQVPLQKADHIASSFFHIEGDQDLSPVIAHVNGWLIEDLPDCYVRVQWVLYAERRSEEMSLPSVHLYHLSVEYISCRGDAQVMVRNEVTLKELWVLFSSRSRVDIVEAAWQRYIRAWACTNMSMESLSTGLQLLWSWLEH